MISLFFMIPHSFSCLHDEVIARERNRDVVGLLDTAILVYICVYLHVFIYIHICTYKCLVHELKISCGHVLYICISHVCVCVVRV